MRILHLLLLSALPVAGHTATITVNTATDDFGAVTTNCSLREAIQSANNNLDFGGCTHTGVYGAAITDNINLPTIAAGSFFTLTRFTGHDDANNSTDLDITGSVNINGVSASNSVIRGNVSDPDNERDRLIHVLSGTVTLNDLTLRDGKLINQAAGAGLRTEPGSTTILNNVVVGQNSAAGNAGGILNRGTMTINESAVTGNSALQPSDGGGGGGIFNSPGATLTLNDSRVLNNTVAGRPGLQSGAGIYSAGTLTLDDSLIDGNTITSEGGINPLNLSQGGGVFASGTTLIRQCTISGNTVSGNVATGGGVFLQGSGGIVERTLITGNTVEDKQSNAFAGGISLSDSILRDSVVSNNRLLGSGRGGGVQVGNGQVINSTVASNTSGGGGGGLSIEGSASLIHVSVLNNQADTGGGGLFLISGGAPTVQLSGITVAGNTSNADNNLGAGDEDGGGLLNFGLQVVLRNSVIAGNSALGAANNDDCDGALNSGGFNLIQSHDNAACPIFNDSNERLNVNAGLAAAANNGGLTTGSALGATAGMLTRAPGAGSPLLDGATPSGCRDGNGVLLTTDQLGNDRALDGPDVNTTATCDIGAVEFVVPNTAPSLSPATAVNREQGTLNSLTAIAAVTDAEQPASVLTVMTTNVPSGITVANLNNDAGTVRANLSVGCAVPVGTAAIGLQVSDGSLSTTGNFNLGVTANQPPTQGNYSNQALPLAGGGSVTPTLAPQDAGTVSTLTVSASGSYTGSVTVTSPTGVVTLGNVGPVGSHTITVTATDNCGAASQRSFTLTVQGDLLLRNGFEDPVLVLTTADPQATAKLMLPVTDLANLPTLGGRELVVLHVQLDATTLVLGLRGDHADRQWQLRDNGDGRELLPWQDLPPVARALLWLRRDAAGVLRAQIE